MFHKHPEHIVALKRAATQKTPEDKPTVSEVIAEYGRACFSDADLELALSEAVSYERLHAVAALIEHGAVVNRFHALAAGRLETPEMLKILFKNGASQELLCSALHGAAGRGSVATLDWLVEQGADPKAESDSAFISAAHTGQLDVLKRMEAIASMDLPARNHVLMIAVERGDADTVEWVVTLHPDCDVDNSAPLRGAIKRDNARMVAALMSAGAKPVDYPKTEQEYNNYRGFVPLYRDGLPFNPEIAKSINFRYAETISNATPPPRRPRSTP